MRALEEIPMRLSTLAVCGTALLSTPAFAHITLERSEAPAGSTYKAVLRVPHGCDGSATTVIRVQIPDGMIAVKPMPKPGWKLETTVTAYAKPVKYFEDTLTEGVTEISWSGGNLPDAWYDEFVFRGQLPDKPGTIYFPVVQECETGVERWIDIPAAGKSSDDYETPAPALKLTPKS
jgi:uncharacterized protein YcnI